MTTTEPTATELDELAAEIAALAEKVEQLELAVVAAFKTDEVGA